MTTTEWVDLTAELRHGLAHFVHPAVTIIDYHQRRWNAQIFKPPSQGFDTKLVILIDHHGTHVDAPSHIHPGGVSIEDVPLESLMGPAVVLDVTDRRAGGPVTPADLERSLSHRGTDVRKGDIVLIRAWSGEWLAEGFYECRGITGESTDWLIERGAKAVGTDLATLDDQIEYAPSRPAHVNLLGQNIPIIENLVNLEKVRTARCTFLGLPLRIRGLTASPIRAIAFEGEVGLQ